MSTQKTPRREYLVLFEDSNAPPSCRQKEALKHALDIRKFEIDTYWKRATYFWTLIAGSFLAFFSLKNSQGDLSVIVMGSIGMLLSLGWYMVNRGSGSWQKNWEAHVDLLEDEVMGPLYKTLINKDTHCFLDLTGPYSYSPSRINTLMSLFVFIAWILLLSATIWDFSRGSQYWVAAFTLFFDGLGIFSLLFWGRSVRSKSLEREFDMQTRVYK